MTISKTRFSNPFRPGAGHMPPHLAGREHETKEYEKLLAQDIILKNLVLTGLRGLGKTVLLETFKPMAISKGWFWAGTDLSESTSISEDNLATRLLADLSVVTSSFVVVQQQKSGFAPELITTTLTFQALKGIYDGTPGLIVDKLKGVLEAAWPHVEALNRRGIIFAYDEAQNLADHAARDQFPLSLLLDLFQSLQRKGIRYMLVLTGLPTLFGKLVEARTYAERMFHVIFLDPLTEAETKDAINKPVEKERTSNQGCPVFNPEAVGVVWRITQGYPYFVQFVCREVYDVWIQATEGGQKRAPVPVQPIMKKLDSDFFAGRWARVTDRQRDLMVVIAILPNCDSEFTVQDIVESGANTRLPKSFSASHVNQMLSTLSAAGLIYKNRHGKYSFAVPLLGDFIKRQSELLEAFG